MNNALIILTARCHSSRLPNKALVKIAGEPLITWIIQRLYKIGSPIVLATTNQPEDDPLEKIARKNNIECYRHPGDINDVVGRMAAAAANYPGTKYIMRGLGDCPFISWEMPSRCLHMLNKTGSDIVLWYMQPDTNSVYGSREGFVSKKYLDLTNQRGRGSEREHFDMYFDHHREQFKILYHEPPPSVYFRPYLRLEVDYPEDAKLVEAVAKNVPGGMMAPLKDIIQWLDQNDWAARLNYGCVEKTGPSISFSSEQKRQWFKLMKGKSVYSWDGHIWEPESDSDSPIFCTSGRCLLGWGQRRDGIIRTVEGHKIKGAAWLTCKCGDGRFTRERF